MISRLRNYRSCSPTGVGGIRFSHRVISDHVSIARVSVSPSPRMHRTVRPAARCAPPSSSPRKITVARLRLALRLRLDSLREPVFGWGQGLFRNRCSAIAVIIFAWVVATPFISLCCWPACPGFGCLQEAATIAVPRVQRLPLTVPNIEPRSWACCPHARPTALRHDLLMTNGAGAPRAFVPDLPPDDQPYSTRLAPPSGAAVPSLVPIRSGSSMASDRPVAGAGE